MESTIEREFRKYEGMWEIPAYAVSSPGERHVKSGLYEGMCAPEVGDSCIDLGCGSGKGGQMLIEKHKLNVTFLDMVDGRVGASKGGNFIQQCLWHPLPIRNPKWKYGFCSDVMEHIPTEYTMLSIRNMLDACDSVWFAISLVDDPWGSYVGEPLHITIRSFPWWLEHLNDLGRVISARDLINAGMYHVTSK